ncbi:MAG: type II toxin-antitoxin system VapC family toxin [Coriobacteriales bacterium]|jgi:predicted nucleic acid-binding protein
MKVLFDSNILVDIWTADKDVADSMAAVDVALLRGYELCIASTVVPSIDCLFSARAKMPHDQVREAMGAVLDIFSVLDVTAGDCQRAYDENPPDLEDAILYNCAHRNNVDAIVTRNKKDFADSPVPALTPCQFIDAHKPPNVSYLEIGLPEGGLPAAGEMREIG